jgi:hypothetical protein
LFETGYGDGGLQANPDVDSPRTREEAIERIRQRRLDDGGG